MDIRYKSVDRSSEMRERKKLNPLKINVGIDLERNEFNINKYLSRKNENSIKTIIPKKHHRRKLPSLDKKFISPPIYDIISKNSDISTEANNAFSLEKDNSEKYYLNMESKKDKHLKNNLYHQIKSIDISDKSSLNNITNSSFGTIFLNPIKMQRKISPLFNKYPNHRLYPRKFINEQNDHMNSIKIIKEIKQNNEKIKQEEKNADYFNKIPKYQSKVAYVSKYEDFVFDANKEINKYRNKKKFNLNNDDDNINSFISKNNQISKNSVIIELMKIKNRKLKEENQDRSKDIDESEKILKNEEKEFDNLINDQRDLYFKVGTIAQNINTENNNLRKLLFQYETKSKSLEDEIFKLIEQIESLRIYAKFIHKVLEEDEKLFEEEIIPDYENDNRPEISILINKVYQKYGYLLNSKKLNTNNNIFNTININNVKSENNNILKLGDNEDKETIEKNDDNENQNELLSDPYLIIRKFKDLEDHIIRIVKREENLNNRYIKEKEANNEIIKDMKNRLAKLNKEYEKEKTALMNYKNNEVGSKNQDMNEKDFYIMANDLCQCIENEDIHINNTINVLELTEKISKCMEIMMNRENLVNNYIVNIENYENKDPKIINDLLNKRRKEIKIINQNNIKQNYKEIEEKKKLIAEKRMNKIIVISRKCEPPLYSQKKEVKIKLDPNTVTQNEDEEMLKYK